LFSIRNRDARPGAHEPIVTKDEFDRVQELLGRPNRQPRQRHAFAFTGLIRCGECGASVTAENKDCFGDVVYVFSLLCALSRNLRLFASDGVASAGYCAE